jgi:arylsulfatase A-like enzyme
MIGTIDLTATMLEIAGYRTLPRTVDGISQLAMLRKCRKNAPEPWRYEDEDHDTEASTSHDPTSRRDYMFIFANHSSGGGDRTRFNRYDAVRYVALEDGRPFKTNKPCPTAPSVDSLYVEWYTGDCEYYDLSRDPHQLYNRCNDTSIVREKQRLARLLDKFRDCAGEACRKLVK